MLSTLAQHHQLINLSKNSLTGGSRGLPTVWEQLLLSEESTLTTKKVWHMSAGVSVWLGSMMARHPSSDLAWRIFPDEDGIYAEGLRWEGCFPTCGWTSSYLCGPRRWIPIYFSGDTRQSFSSELPGLRPSLGTDIKYQSPRVNNPSLQVSQIYWAITPLDPWYSGLWTTPQAFPMFQLAGDKLTRLWLYVCMLSALL